MATISIAWNDGSGDYITLTYTGRGNGTITASSPANNGAARSKVITIETTQGGLVTQNVTVTQPACPVPEGTVLNYSYTGSYQEITLPAGKYKLQVWGAQGGSNAADSSYSITAQAGGKGGYSEGIITLSQNTTVRVYVGGQGSSSAGGYNGGGSTTGSSSYNSGSEFGTSRMGGGGGATDIRLSDGALLSRMIVAGGGSGGAMCYKKTTSTSTVTDVSNVETREYSGLSWSLYAQSKYVGNNGAVNSIGDSRYNIYKLEGIAGKLLTLKGITCQGYSIYYVNLYNSSGQFLKGITSLSTSSPQTSNIVIDCTYNSASYALVNTYTMGTSVAKSSVLYGSIYSSGSFHIVAQEIPVTSGKTYTVSGVPSGFSVTWKIAKSTGQVMGSTDVYYSENNTSSGEIRSGYNYVHIYLNGSSTLPSYTISVQHKETSIVETTESQVGGVGGGTQGGGYSTTYVGKQNAAGTGGSFGQGANQTASNYGYCSGAGGGGWYGGGGGQSSDSSMTYCKYSGGGSGWVNTYANRGNRPSGYTALQLDSGSTTAGSSSFPATGGGNETGHSGNGYARITRLS